MSAGSRVRALLALLILCGVSALSRAAESDPAADAVSAAQAEAKRRGLPLLVDFRAPWCYSCYFMSRNVHTGAEWRALLDRTVLLELDADSPEGAAQMKAWNVKALPSYLVFDGAGEELGRVLGEQPRETFYGRLDQFLQRGSTLDRWRELAAAGGPTGLRAAGEALTALHARADAAAGLAWFYDLPGRVRRGYEKDPGVGLRLARLRLMQAAEARNPRSCAAIAPEVLAGELGCERPYELSRVRSCLATDDDSRVALLQTQRAPMEQLAESGVFGATASCADQRSVVLGLSDLYRELGEPALREQLLLRAVAALSERLGDSVGKDRSQADNLRAYLELLRDWSAYDALMPRLVAAWPEDYVYAFRFGRSLLERDRGSEALPYLERAAGKAYGLNRLRVAEQRVRALKRLGRGEEAKAVVSEALRANGPWFPGDAARLKALL